MENRSQLDTSTDSTKTVNSRSDIEARRVAYELEARRVRRDETWQRSGVPERHSDLELISRLINTPEGKWGEVLVKLQAMLPTGFLCAVLGKRGTGKTQLAVCLMAIACRKDMSIRYVKAMDLFRDIKATYDGDSARRA
jgi:ABC-type protease/lipase transport system fused ATPase/permease subunit